MQDAIVQIKTVPTHIKFLKHKYMFLIFFHYS